MIWFDMIFMNSRYSHYSISTSTWSQLFTSYEKNKLKNSAYLNKHCRSFAENQKLSSPETLDILVPQEFASVQRANLRLAQNLRRSSLWHQRTVESCYLTSLGCPSKISQRSLEDIGDITLKILEISLKFLSNFVFHTWEFIFCNIAKIFNHFWELSFL